MQLLERVRQTIRQHDLAERETRVVVALSGGSDSVALAHLLRALDDAGELRVAGFAHFNHQLRPSALVDEELCETVAASLERPLFVDRADVAALARRERRSIEDAGRHARYEFLARARVHFSADLVALGHTRDDQAETFLIRLLRGAGPRGLAAMHPRRGAIIRPLLDCRRAELRAYLEARGVHYVHDESNDDVRVTRNRVRAELMPLLERRFNPAIVDVLANEAALARDEWRWMEDEAADFGRLCRWTGLVCRIETARLNRLPPALARLVLYRAMTKAAGGRSVSFTDVERALRLSRHGGAGIDLRGHRLERLGPDIVLTGRPPGGTGRAHLRTRPATNLFRYPLSIPGEVWIAEAGGLLSAELAAAVPSAVAIMGNDAMAAVQLDQSGGPFAVRNRRPGDRFRPLGLGGGKKLQDFFVDRKVARESRDRVPLVVDASDHIVWVAGHEIDERFRVMDPAKGVVVLRLRQT